MKFDNIEQHSVAHFIKKTYQILQISNHSHIVQWLSSGREFSIRDVDGLEREVLPTFFRHRNIHSFIRQLNMYGFHKSRKDPSKNIFSHQHFQRGREELLPLVKRKIRNQEKNEENLPNEEFRTVQFLSNNMVQEEIKQVLSQKTENYNQSEIQKKQPSEKFDKIELSLNPSNHQLSLQSMICPSSVLNQNSAQIFSNLHENDDNLDESFEEDDNLSIEGEIQKERQVFQNRTSGVSLVLTRTLLQTQNKLSDPDI